MPAGARCLSRCTHAGMDRPAIAHYPAGTRLPWRVIDDYELVWMLRGRAQLVLENASVTLGPRELLLLPPGVRHAIDWDVHRPASHGYVHFGPAHFGGHAPRVPQVRSMTADDPLEGLCAYLLWLSRREDWEPSATAILELLLCLLGNGPLPEDDRTAPLTVSLSHTLEHLREVWAEPPLRRITVAELAAASFVSRGYLSRLFRATFGLSTASALERLRCARAETLLRRTDLTADTIASQCGFADGSHFSHRFTMIHGLSPLAFREATGDTRSVLHHTGLRRLSYLVWD
jgi:AraC family transcriptional regulator